MYPKYLKAVDPDGNATALIYQENEDKIIILQPVAATNRPGYEVDIFQAVSSADVKAHIGGRVFDCPPDEYNEILFSMWGFDGSKIYRAGGGLEDDNPQNNDSPATIGNADDTLEGKSASDTEGEASGADAGEIIET